MKFELPKFLGGKAKAEKPQSFDDVPTDEFIAEMEKADKILKDLALKIENEFKQEINNVFHTKADLEYLLDRKDKNFLKNYFKVNGSISKEIQRLLKAKGFFCHKKGDNLYVAKFSDKYDDSYVYKKFLEGGESVVVRKIYALSYNQKIIDDNPYTFSVVQIQERQNDLGGIERTHKYLYKIYKNFFMGKKEVCKEEISKNTYNHILNENFVQKIDDKFYIHNQLVFKGKPKAYKHFTDGLLVADENNKLTLHRIIET